MVRGILAAADGAAGAGGGGPPAYTWILGIVLGLVALAVTLKPPVAERWLRIGAAVCWIAAVEFLGLLVSASVLVRIGVGIILFGGYLVWEFCVRGKSRVSENHAHELVKLLDAAVKAIRNRSALSLDPQQTSMFSSHYPSLADSLSKWDECLGKAAAARQALEAEMKRRLAALPADSSFDVDALAKGLSAITEARARDAHLDEPVRPMLEGASPVFSVSPDEPRRTCMIAFDERPGLAAGLVAKFDFDASTASGGVGKHAETILKPVYSLLEEAQSWGDARKMLYTSQEVEKFPRDKVQKAIRAARAHRRIPTAANCPVCGVDRPAHR